MFKVHLSHAQAILQSHSPSQVTLTNFNFSNPEVGGGGLHLQVDRKSVRFIESDWLSAAAASGQQCQKYWKIVSPKKWEP